MGEGKPGGGASGAGRRVAELGVPIGDEGPGARGPAAGCVVPFDVADAVLERLLVEAEAFVVAGGTDGAAVSRLPLPSPRWRGVRGEVAKRVHGAPLSPRPPHEGEGAGREMMGGGRRGAMCRKWSW